MMRKTNKLMCLLLTAVMVITAALPLHAENGISTAENAISAEEESGKEQEILKGDSIQWETFDPNDWEYQHSTQYEYDGYVITYYKSLKNPVNIIIPGKYDGGSGEDRSYVDINAPWNTSSTPFFPASVKAVRFEGSDDFNRVSVYSLAEIFSNSNVEYAEFNYSSFMYPSSDPAFKDCNTLKEVHFNHVKFDDSFSTPQRLFDGCTGLKTVYFDGCDFSNTYSTVSMFKNCTNLKYVYFKNTDFSGIQNFQNMFKGCTSLKKIYMILPSSNPGLTGAVGADSMFEGCSSLERIYVNSGFTISASLYNAGEADNLFLGCEKLFGEKGCNYGNYDNSRPADFFHIDHADANPADYGFLSAYFDNSDPFLEDWLYEVNGDYCDLTRYTGSEEIVTIPQNTYVADAGDVQSISKKVKIKPTLSGNYTRLKLET